MPDIHFMQHGFTYSACEPFTIKRKKPKKKKIQKNEIQNISTKNTIQIKINFNMTQQEGFSKKNNWSKILCDKAFDVSK